MVDVGVLSKSASEVASCTILYSSVSEAINALVQGELAYHSFKDGADFVQGEDNASVSRCHQYRIIDILNFRLCKICESR